ncbi:UNVERIFIED_CONTAM: putative disease resistance protein [Sesamum latifolium]|uniref:Disease resistance protein n=1 Tax=Sesamum latifolium TaxID=2727402 RepID=A0AAW2UKJ3_9LAMI
MADAAITFLLENGLQLVKSYHDLISGAESELKQLRDELALLKAYLRQASRKEQKDDPLREMERQMREAIYDAEDIIDSCLTDAGVANSKLGKMFRNLRPRRGNLASQVKSLRTDTVTPLLNKAEKFFANMQTGEGDLPPNSPVVHRTRGDGDALQSGRLIRIRAVAQRWRATEPVVHRWRVKELSPRGDGGRPEVPSIRQDKIVGFEDEEKTVLCYLMEKRPKLDVISIIGMPGLGKTTLAWKVFQNEDVKYEFPIRIWVNVSQELNMKDVLVTILKGFRKNDDLSRLDYDDLHESVCESLKTTRFLLVLDDVWTVDALEAIKKVLPDDNMMAKEKESWELLRLKVFEDDPCPDYLESTGKQIAKKCGGLPLALVVIGGILVDQFSKAQGSTAILSAWEDVEENVNYEIPAWTLTRLWIAEGFIQQEGTESLEKTAEENLNDLIKFFKEIKKSKEGVLHPPVADIDKYRRLCMHSNLSDFLSSARRLKGPGIRSFLCFYNEPFAMEAKYIATIPDAFPLLRPSLSYGTFKLVIDTKCRTIEIEANIWKLIQLRHIKTKAAIKLLETRGEGRKAGENLQTLSRLSPESCKDEVFTKARNLKKLGISGRLHSLLEANSSLENLAFLENLKLVNDLSSELETGGRCVAFFNPNSCRENSRG